VGYNTADFKTEQLRSDDIVLRYQRNVNCEEHHMGIISTIIFGIVIGVIAKFLMPGKNEPSGFILTAILGIVGSMLASYGGQALGFYKDGQGAGWIASIIGAIVVLAIYGMVTKPKV
jgi:uncharacterized membrane protein YeaQ/YmgE (transglycosylase-associated protein family)